MTRFGFLALAFVAFGNAALLGQTYVVDSLGGPGSDFSNLQDALDTVPENSTLIVQGWFTANGTQAYRITKSVALRAVPYPGGASYPSIICGIVIDAPDADISIDEFWSSDSNSGLYGSRTQGEGIADAVQVVTAHSVIVRNSWVGGGATDESSGSLLYGAGLRVVGPIDFVELIGCTAVGWNDGYYAPDTLTLTEGSPWIAPKDGAPGVALPADLVGFAALENCSARGGIGMYLQYLCDDSIDVDPSGPLTAGNGGPGLVGNCDARSCVFTGGAGGIFVPDSPDDCSDGTGQDGQPGKDVDGVLTDRVFGPTSMDLILGSTGSIVAPGKTSGDLALILLSTDLVGPFHLRGINGALQVLPPWFVVVTTVGSNGFATVSVDVPNDPSIDGVELFAQSFSGGDLSMIGACRIRAP